jgi:hypothetical protein
VHAAAGVQAIAAAAQDAGGEENQQMTDACSVPVTTIQGRLYCTAFETGRDEEGPFIDLQVLTPDQFADFVRNNPQAMEALDQVIDDRAREIAEGWRIGDERNR